LKIYCTKHGVVVENQDRWYSSDLSFEELVVRDNLKAFLETTLPKLRLIDRSVDDRPQALLAPIGSQEVWAAGVTYHRSRDARMEESESAGGGDFYDRVYHAERPELFFKATPHRVVGPGGKVAIRSDAKWSVPEPELALLLSPSGKILGYTIGNDMSSRDIEGENPLYLPQAKVYDRSCALGPCILVSSDALDGSTEIRLEILRSGVSTVRARTTLSELKRELKTLVEYLYRDNSFPMGSCLLTGTGIVPPDNFTLAHGDEIRITIEPIGTLVNFVG
jgi:2-dehydro-3-deoxy-D-arabinonate dehydratase